MNPFEESKWIWASENPRNDEYSEFIDEVHFSGGNAELYISSDSNYTVYINGTLCAFGQYADFPYMKVYDKIDVSRYMRKGKNIIAFRVWYYGIANSQTYCPGKAGLIYSLFADSNILSCSSAKTLSRLSPTFVPYKEKRITVQLGLTFEYDAKAADAWMLGEWDDSHPFGQSFEVDISPQMRERTCKRTEFGETFIGKAVNADGIAPVSKRGMIFDLGREAVGFICLKLVASSESPITIAFGEHLVDGHVRREVGGRDFSFIYHPTLGLNYYMNAFRRFGCRYIELITDEALSDVEVSLRSVVYPLADIQVPDSLTLKESAIYEACAYTMKCCMHEHYEDCPWREQALYTMDSRNQMLAGYYAFGETLFPKSNIELIAEDNRDDNILSICYPISHKRAIPSFSLHFILECEEYLRYTGDVQFIEKIYPKLTSVMNAFIEKIDTVGLIPPFRGEYMWNFYEWTDGLAGAHSGPEKEAETYEYDLVLNALLSIAISRMIDINNRLGKDSARLIEIKKILNASILINFYDCEEELFETRNGTKHYSKLANALAILSGAADEYMAKRIAELITTREDVIDASLSMRAFYYDALLLADKDTYASYILDEISATYEPMLKQGNGTVWETVLGEADFDNAGSLCHGWSAIPIYYYHLLKP